MESPPPTIWLLLLSLTLAIGVIWLVYKLRDLKQTLAILREEARTAINSSQERHLLAALIENCSDFIGIADKNGDPVYLNPAGRKMVGLSPDYPIELTKISDFYPESERQRTQETICKAMVNEGYWSGETKFRNFETNAEIPVSDTHFLIHDPDTKEMIGMGTITRDISEHQKRLQAESDARANGEFLASMSHEIRTPLAVIMGYIQLLQAKNLSRKEKDLITQKISRVSDQLQHLLDEVLDLSALQKNEQPNHEGSLDLHLFLQDYLEQAQCLAGEKRLFVRADILSSLPRKMIADETKIRQILTNLMSNAVKFTEEGGVTVQVIAAVPTADQCQLTVLVSDTGRGIDAADAEKIFGLFQRSDTRVKGTGLGLAISRTIAKKLGGTLTLASSERGKGSCFALQIPVKLEPDTDWFSGFEDASGKIRQPAMPLRNGGDRIRMLIAEDAEELREILRLYLQDLNADVDFAANGDEALNKAGKNDYDIVILDIEMPVLSGLSVMSTLKKLNFRTPVIAMSAHASQEVKNKCIEAGFRDYLVKPVRKRELLQHIDALLDHDSPAARWQVPRLPSQQLTALSSLP